MKKQSLHAVWMGLGFCLSAGCVTAGLSVDRLKYGATEAGVLQELGEPDKRESFPEQPASDASASPVLAHDTWTYAMEGTRCYITFTRGLLFTRPRCQSDEQRSQADETRAFRENWSKQTDAENSDPVVSPQNFKQE